MRSTLFLPKIKRMHPIDKTAPPPPRRQPQTRSHRCPRGGEAATGPAAARRAIPTADAVYPPLAELLTKPTPAGPAIHFEPMPAPAGQRTLPD
jgi:hypothetical protein